MRLLVLGGTSFLGRHVVEAALSRGHEVTLFNRGRTNPTLYPEAERLRGDRDGDLSALRGRRWDAAVDTCGFVPRVVRVSAKLLADAVDLYAFVSTLNAYADFGTPDMDEDAPLATLEDETTETVTDRTYGPLKALCERAAESALPGRVLVVRPGLIAGPYDPTDRFTYWPHRSAQGGEVLAPESPEVPIRFVDARNLAAWLITLTERRQGGVFNALGPEESLTMGAFLEQCRDAASGGASLTWVDAQFLLDAGVAPYTEMPLWVPNPTGPKRVGYVTLSRDRAAAARLTFRPVPDTIRHVLEWDATRAPGAPLKAGLAPEREAALLAAWRRREVP